MIEKMFIDLAEAPRTRFARSSLLVFLSVAIYYAAHIKLYQAGERLNAMSIFSFVPNSVLFNSSLFLGLRVIFILCACLWMLQLLTPLTSWTAVICFTFFASQTAESSLYTGHQYNLINLILIVYAVWYQVDPATRKPVISWREFFGEQAMPRWVYVLSLFALCSMYSLSGATKLLHCGLDWANGISLQLWVHRFADQSNMLASFMIAYWPLAFIAQVTVLFAEVTAAFAIFWSPLRLIIGPMLLVFHLCNEWLFDFKFYGNTAAILMLLIVMPLIELREQKTAGSSP